MEDSVTKHYGETVELRYLDKKHQYSVRPLTLRVPLPADPSIQPGGRWLYAPSSTTITKLLDKSEVLMGWQMKIVLAAFEEYVYPDLIYPALQQVIEYVEDRWKEGLSSEQFFKVLADSIGNAGLDEVLWSQLKDKVRRAPSKDRDEAGLIGTLVHGYLEKFINWRMDGEVGEMPELPVNKVAHRAVKRWLQWEEANHVEWIGSEQKIYSLKYHFAGTFDALCYLNNELVLIDFKTSKRVYDEHFFQTAAYAFAIEEEFGERPERRMIQQIAKDTGAVTPHILEDESKFRIEDDFAAFLGLRQTYRRLQGI